MTIVLSSSWGDAMSSNKGKDGEMRVVKVLASVGQLEEGVDFTRPSTTNTADMGADLYLFHPSGFLDKFANIANGNAPNQLAPIEQKSGIKSSQKTRIDVKATSNKIHAQTVRKFISDTHKHPDCTGHLLVGGAELSKTARQEFDEARVSFGKHGKKLDYIKNDGIINLEKHYHPRILDGGDNEPPSE